jgi:hypothetical protein
VEACIEALHHQGRALGQAAHHGNTESTRMKHAIYEDRITIKFALVRLPDNFVEGDTLSILPTERWFDSREEALAALPELFDREE